MDGTSIQKQQVNENTIRLTTAQAIVRFLAAQRIEVSERVEPVFAGMFAIFGHGNVTCLGDALQAAGDVLPTWRGQNEQSMGMAAVAFAKARLRRQMMVVTSSIGPGSMNLVTAAGIAMANRLPMLILGADTFTNRIPDPVLQQVEHFGDPTRTANDAFRAVVRYWDRITTPEQLLTSLPRAVSVLLDPAECGPAFIGLPQDVQEQAYDFPAAFFEPRIHRIRRPEPDPVEISEAAEVLRTSDRPLLIAGGGVHYSKAEDDLRHFAEEHGIPVTETMAGKSCLRWGHPNYIGPIGVTGSSSANDYAARADLILAVGTRLQDFTTGSWSVFQHESVRLVSINVGAFDASKRRAITVVADARASLHALTRALENWRAPEPSLRSAQEGYATWNRYLDDNASRDEAGLPSYASVIRTVNDHAEDSDYIVAAAGGFPGELNKNWRSLAPRTFDCEYGFSCMGYEVGGAWGAAIALADRQVISFCGDGSYLMANSELYSSIISDHPFIMILCDNGGYAVIERLQVAKGAASFNNMLTDVRGDQAPNVDFVAHARALGVRAELIERLDDLPDALEQARAADRSSVIVMRTDPEAWTDGDAWWDVGVPETSERQEVREARALHEKERQRQRSIL